MRHFLEIHRNLAFIIFPVYLGPKIRSASGAPFDGTYFAFFSLFKFKAGPGDVRFVTFIIDSINQNKNQN